jgi:hypothetical protein
MKFPLLILLFVFTVSMSAEVLETLPEIDSSGRILKNAKIMKVKPNGLQIMHEAGMETVPWVYLPADLQAKYRTDETMQKASAVAAVENAEREKAAVAARVMAREKEAIRLHELTGQSLDDLTQALMWRDWCTANPEGGVLLTTDGERTLTKVERDKALESAMGWISYRPEKAVPQVAMPQTTYAEGNSLSRGAAPQGVGGVAPVASGRSMKDNPERRLETAARRGNLQAAAALAGIPMAAGGVIESFIDGEFKGFENGRIYKLRNGQIWEQTDYHFEYHYAYSPEVMIISKSDGVFLQVDGLDKKVRVQQIR